jgi:hypothetical protein
MGSKVSTPVRILALVGLLGALALAAGFTLLGPSSGSSAPAPAIKPLHPVHKLTTTPAPAPKLAAKPKPAAAKHHAVARPAKAARRPAAGGTKAKATPAAVPANGLPAVINQALVTHEVVVVSLYDPQANVDAASLGEALAGAKAAGAGFVGLDVLQQSAAEPLAKKFGVLPDPALLIFRRPGDLAFRVDGFADRDTVAQAAANALAGLPPVTAGG